jgi:hypothetical protein
MPMIHFYCPAGALEPEAQRAGLVKEMTEIVLDAETTEHEAVDAGRVFCLIREIGDGFWGGMGALFPIQDIFDFAVNEDGGSAHVRAAREAVAGGLFEPSPVSAATG